jgi:hypothetical protein
MLNAAGPVEPPRFLTANLDTAKVGLHYLVAAIRSRKPLTDSRALDAAKTDKEKLALKLADLYLESIRPERAEKILLRVAEGDPLLGPVSRDCRAYAILQLAVALDRQAESRSEAIKWLEKLTEAEYRGTYWGGYGLFRLGVFTYNHTQDAKASLAIYEEMMVRYPDHPMAERAHAYYCFNAIRAGETAKGRQAAQAFLNKYPKSEWIPSIRQLIRDNAG